MTPETSFLMDLFNALAEHQINYCVLRNYEGLPYDLQGHDIDILLEESLLEKTLLLIRRVSIKNGGVIFWRRWNDYMYFLECTGKTANGERWGVLIDLLTAIRWHGCDWYSSSDVLSRSLIKGQVRIAEANDAYMIAFLDKILIKGFSNQAYASSAADAFIELMKKTDGKLDATLGHNIYLLDKFFKENDFSKEQHIDKMAILAKKLRFNLQKRNLIQSPLKTIKNKLKRFRSHLHRLILRPGVSVAVMGCDGSGKTTLIEMACNDLYRLLHMYPEKSFHRPNLLPRLAVLFEKDTGPALPSNPNPHSHPPSGFIGSIFRLLFYSIDYCLGYWAKVYPHLVQPPLVFFFDRYFYDYFIDPARWRVSAPAWVVSLFNYFIPKPDLVIILDAKPEVLFNRKPELPLSEIKKQSERMKLLAKKLENVLFIDTSADINVSRRKIVDAVLESLYKRPGWHVDSKHP